MEYPKHLNRRATAADVARQVDSRYNPATSNHPFGSRPRCPKVAVDMATRIHPPSYDVALIVDVVGGRDDRARKIDRRVHALAQQKTMDIPCN